MANREYVIMSLKYLHDKETWKEGPLVWDDHAADRRRITKDALALLREQEPVKPTKQHIEKPEVDLWYCGECGNWIAQSFTYCPWCGRKVLWDDAE